MTASTPTVVLMVVRLESDEVSHSRTKIHRVVLDLASAVMARLTAGSPRPGWRARRSVGRHPVQGCLPWGFARRHGRLTDTAAHTNRRPQRFKTLGAHRLAPVRKHDAPYSSRRAPHE